MGGIRRHKRRHRNRNKTEPKNDEQVSKTVNVNYDTIIFCVGMPSCIKRLTFCQNLLIDRSLSCFKTNF